MVRKRKSHYNTISPRETLTPSSPSNKSSRACFSSALDRSFICWIWCLAVAKTEFTFLQFYFKFISKLNDFQVFFIEILKFQNITLNMSLIWILFRNVLESNYLMYCCILDTYMFIKFEVCWIDALFSFIFLRV